MPWHPRRDVHPLDLTDRLQISPSAALLAGAGVGTVFSSPDADDSAISGDAVATTCSNKRSTNSLLVPPLAATVRPTIFSFLHPTVPNA